MISEHMVNFQSLKNNITKWSIFKVPALKDFVNNKNDLNSKFTQREYCNKPCIDFVIDTLNKLYDNIKE